MRYSYILRDPVSIGTAAAGGLISSAGGSLFQGLFGGKQSSTNTTVSPTEAGSLFDPGAGIAQGQLQQLQQPAAQASQQQTQQALQQKPGVMANGMPQQQPIGSNNSAVDPRLFLNNLSY